MYRNTPRLIIGLGNPGASYQRSWHNLGWLALDLIREQGSAGFADWQEERSSRAWIARCQLPGCRIILAKPTTMMNNSGLAVKALLQAVRGRPEDLWLIHDELDLPLGTIRISRNATAAGHRGVASAIETIGTAAFTRFRLGISTPERANLEAETYVLQPIPEAHWPTVEAMLQKTYEAVELALLAGVTEAMNHHN